MRSALVTYPLLTFALASVLPDIASACDYPRPIPYEIDANSQDDEAPAAPRMEIERVRRGKEPDREGCSQHSTSCDDLGYALLHVEQGEADLGYIVEVKGKAPLRLAPSGPIALLQPGELRLVWTDGEGERDYDFDVYLWSVDRAGNVSETPAKVHVDSAGASGCATSGRNTNGGWLGLLVLALLARRRKR